MKVKQKILLLLLYGFIFTTYFIQATGNPEDTPVIFRFTLAQKDSNDNIKIIEWDNTHDPDFRIPKNNQIQFYFEPLNALHVYMYALDSENNFSVLKENQWYEFYGDAEYNQFYILIAGFPLEKLEKLTRDYIKLTHGQDAIKIDIIKHDLIEEIRSMQNKYVKNRVEILPPPPITGSVKGGFIEESAIGDYAVKIQAEYFYTQTIRIFNEE